MTRWRTRRSAIRATSAEARAYANLMHLRCHFRFRYPRPARWREGMDDGTEKTTDARLHVLYCLGYFRYYSAHWIIVASRSARTHTHHHCCEMVFGIVHHFSAGHVGFYPQILATGTHCWPSWADCRKRFRLSNAPSVPHKRHLSD